MQDIFPEDESEDEVDPLDADQQNLLLDPSSDDVQPSQEMEKKDVSSTAASESSD